MFPCKTSNVAYLHEIELGKNRIRETADKWDRKSSLTSDLDIAYSHLSSKLGERKAEEYGKTLFTNILKAVRVADRYNQDTVRCGIVLDEARRIDSLDPVKIAYRLMSERPDYDEKIAAEEAYRLTEDLNSVIDMMSTLKYLLAINPNTSAQTVQKANFVAFDFADHRPMTETKSFFMWMDYYGLDSERFSEQLTIDQ